MDDLLLHGLKDIYYAENQIVKSLPKLIDNATNRDLSKGLEGQLANALRGHDPISAATVNRLRELLLGVPLRPAVA
jgi:hypothetical protein